MLQLDNFFAWITVDDREVTEFGFEYSQNLLCATCWIASEEQKVRQLQYRPYRDWPTFRLNWPVEYVELRCSLARFRASK